MPIWKTGSRGSKIICHAKAKLSIFAYRSYRPYGREWNPNRTKMCMNGEKGMLLIGAIRRLSFKNMKKINKKLRE